MHVTACLAGHDVDVEVGENCRTLPALKESIVKALPQLCVEGFDVSVDGCSLDDDEAVVSLEEGVRLDVSANARGLSVLALREAGREVSDVGLQEAAEEGDVALCTLYLDAGVPVDCVNYDSNTPLHFSCWEGHSKVATLLLDRGSAAIDTNNDHGESPLFLACEGGHVEVAALLLDRGSTAINDRVEGGSFTPLLVACDNEHLDVAELLLDRGCTIDVKDRDGSTALHHSCCSGHLEVATLLLDRGSAAINEENDDCKTPLLLACHAAHVDVATLLLDRGCSVNVEALKSSRPFLRVIVDLLLSRGHDVRYPTK